VDDGEGVRETTDEVPPKIDKTIVGPNSKLVDLQARYSVASSAERIRSHAGQTTARPPRGKVDVKVT
jgi:hypothetical protein